MRVTPTKVRKRLMIVMVAFFCVFSLLTGRLIHIQVLAARFFKEKTYELIRRNIPVPAVRGAILDNQGQALVYTASASSIIAVPIEIKNANATANELYKIIGGTPKGIEKLLKSKVKMVYIRPRGRRLSEAQTKAILALKIPGIYLTEEGKRTYPFGSLAGQVLGVTGGEGQGLTGIELSMNQVLTGKKGYIQYVANARGQQIPGTNDEYIPPVSGEDVQLTINKQIQQFAEREIQNVVAKYKPDQVTMIVANPKNGQILAMANYPSYNPVNWRNTAPAVYNRNLAIWQTFEPGSTFKIVTLAASLQEKKVALSDRFYDPGYYEVGGHRIRCWKAGGHGSQSYMNVVENSCNPGFIQLGERLGKTQLFSYIKKFGFGTKTGINLPGEGKGILFPLNKVGPLELATTSFGQGVSVTPIQQVMAMSAIANGGLLLKPEIVKSLINPTTKAVIKSYSTVVKHRVISESVAAQVRSALESVVAQGTGSNAYREGYRIAGKTGTAQVVENGRYSGTHYIVSFVGMAPANNPQLVAYVAIDYPRPQGPVFGGVIAAPVVGNVLADSLAYLGVKPSVTGISKKYKYGIDPVMTSVPSLDQRTLNDAKRTIIESGSLLRVQLVGSGSYVIAQSPKAGVKIVQGGVVRLYLGMPPGSNS